MFSETLLDSSPARASVLTARHRTIVLLVGVLGFVTCLTFLPAIVFSAGTKALLVQSAIVAAALMFHALMLCYVHAEAMHSRLRAWPWLILTLVFSFAGFLAFLVYSAAQTGDWRRATLPVAYMVEALLLGALVLAPLIHTQALGLNELRAQVTFLPSPPPPPAPPPSAQVARQRIPHAPSPVGLIAPPRIPTNIDVLPDEPAPPQPPSEGVIGGGGVLGGTRDGVIGSILLGLATPIPPPPIRAALPKQVRIRVGGQVEAAKAIFQPVPDYPPLAKMARVQGAVKLEAVIGRDGKVENLRALSGPALLIKAALDAVARWRYQPTLLNGEPVEVLTEIDVKFQLAD